MDDRRRRFEAQVLPHLDAAYRFARWLARSSGGADDIVQEAILRAYRGFDGLRGSDAKGWLLAIVRNCHATALKQQQRQALVPLPEEHDAQDGHALIATTPDPEDASIRRDQNARWQGSSRGLPEDYREILILREVEDMDYREIAAVMNVPIGYGHVAAGAGPCGAEKAMAVAGRGRTPVPCPESLRVQAYFDGEVDAVAAADIEQHMEQCAECRILHQDARAAARRDLRRDLPYVQYPAGTACSSDAWSWTRRTLPPGHSRSAVGKAAGARGHSGWAPAAAWA